MGLQLAEKTVPLSVRITSSDADFIARLSIDGAVTHSDKVRRLIQTAREREAGSGDPNQFRDLFEETFRPTLRAWRKKEAETGESSELIAGFAEWLLEAAVFFAVVGRDGRLDRAGAEALADLEQGVADRVARLAEAFLRLGVTREAPCYDPAVIAKRSARLVELAQIMSNHVIKQESQ